MPNKINLTAYQEATHTVINSKNLAIEHYQKLVLARVSLIVFHILCIGGATATILYTSRHKPRYALLIQGGCCLGTFCLLKVASIWYNIASKKATSEIEKLNEIFKIFTRLKRINSNVEPITALNEFYSEKARKANTIYQNLFQPTEKRLIELKKYFHNKARHAYILAISECKDFKDPFDSWVTEWTGNATIPLKPERIYLQFNGFSILSTLMEELSTQAISQIMITAIKRSGS
jgi:hypothetical protein